MNQVILYPNTTGGICMCSPADCGLSVYEIARKDVPAGVPFLLIPSAEAPQDHTFFAAFEADFSNPDGFGIGPEAWFVERAEMEQS